MKKTANQSPEHKGKPAKDGKQKASQLPNPDNRKEDEKMADRYTEGPDEVSDNVHETNQNRNRNKP